MDRCLLEFDVLRRKAGPRAVAGACFRKVLRPSCAWKCGPLSGRKVAFSAKCSGALGFVGSDCLIRRLSDPCCGPARQDVLTATGMDAQSGEEDPFHEALAACREAKEKGKD